VAEEGGATSRAEQSAAADRAAITAFRDIMPKQAARLLSFGVRLKDHLRLTRHHA
jgi:hypothetical protein